MSLTDRRDPVAVARTFLRHARTDGRITVALSAELDPMLLAAFFAGGGAQVDPSVLACVLAGGGDACGQLAREEPHAPDP